MRAGFAIKQSASTVETIAKDPAKVGGPSRIDRVVEVLAICSRACAAAHYYEAHTAMSDAALAARGLKRADLPRAAFDKLTGATTWPCPYTAVFRIRSALSESIVRCKFICDISATRADGRKRLISA